MHVIKDNSLSLLEFVFVLNFDEIIFPENPIKIIRNKDTYLTPIGGAMYSSGGSNEPPELANFLKIYIYIYNIFCFFI